MRKNNTRAYLILGTLFALVSIVAFIVPTFKAATFWITYTFTAAAFAAQIVIWKAALGKDTALKSKFLGFPIIHIGIVYLVLQLIAFAVFAFSPFPLPAWSAVVACSVIAGVSAVCMIAADTARDEIQRLDEKVQKKVFYIRELQADVELLISCEKDSETKAAFTKLAEKIRFSDPMSNELLSELESLLVSKVDLLKTSTNKVEIITEINSLLDERNKKCRLLK